MSLSLWAEVPASHSPSPDSEKAWQTRVATWHSSSLDLLTASGLNSLYGKMCPACIPLGRMSRRVLRPKNREAVLKKLSELQERPDLTLEQISALKALKKLTSPTILTASSPVWKNSAMGSRQEFLTLNSSESPKDAVASSLSDVLEVGPVPPQYYLSAKACRGILRRAAKRGRELPPVLLASLRAAAKADMPDDEEKMTSTSSELFQQELRQAEDLEQILIAAVA